MILLNSLFSGVISLFLENPIGQWFGFVAMAIWILGLIVLEDKKTIKIFIISGFFWMLHFIFLWNIAALWATIIGIIRLFLSLRYQKNIYVLWLVVLVSIIFWYFSYDGTLLSLLPLIATSIASYGFFFLEKAQLRILLGFVSLMWLSYHLQTGSMSWVVNEVIVQWTIIYSIYRFMTDRERYSYNTQTGKISWRNRILLQLKKKPKLRQRIDFWRFAILRDKNRFESQE